MKRKLMWSVLSLILVVAMVSGATPVFGSTDNIFPMKRQLPAKSILDPMAFYVGRVTKTPGESASVTSIDLSKYSDTSRKFVKSVTGELAWDYKNGLATVNTAKSQGVTGFLSKKGRVDLSDVIIESGDDYGTILAISLDGLPLATSKKILLQAVTDEINSGYRTQNTTVRDDAGKPMEVKKITNFGMGPIQVNRIDASVTLKKGNDIARVVVLDENGYAKSTIKWSPVEGEGSKIKLPEDSLYTVIERQSDDLKELKIKKSSSNYVWWEAEDYVESNYPSKTDFSAETFESTRNDILSGGNLLAWQGLVTEGNQPYAKYTIDVKKDGTYNFYTRKFWKHGPFSWRFDDQAWTDLPYNVSMLDSVTVRKFYEFNWVAAGSVTLKAGKHTFELKVLPSEKSSGAGKSIASVIDCFLLIEGAFAPAGKMKPGEKTKLKENGYFPFEPEADDYSSECYIDFRSMNEENSGQNGYVRREGDHFVLGDGKPVKFWSVCCRENEWNADKISVDSLARNLAKKGVNYVRVLDTTPFYKIDYVKNTVTINQTNLDKLHYFTSVLKKNGIYLHLSLYWYTTIEPSFNWTGYYSGLKATTLVRFDPTLQRLYKDILTGILTPVNPYTNLPLAKDPTLATYEIENEDSYLFFTFTSAKIPKVRLQQLGRIWAEWCKKKYGSISKTIDAWGEAGLIKQDEPENSMFYLLSTYDFTQSRTSTNKVRLTDELEFITENQKGYYQMITDYLKNELGFKGMIDCGNWHTADAAKLETLERYSYTPGDMMDNHGYFSGYHKGDQSSYKVNTGDVYQDLSALTVPDKIPLRYAQNANYPMVLSEVGWSNPNKYRADQPFLLSCYGSLQGLDAPMIFQAGITWDKTTDKFKSMTPVIAGQFPGFSLLFRRGDVKESPDVVTEVADLKAIYKGGSSTVYENINLDDLNKK